MATFSMEIVGRFGRMQDAALDGPPFRGLQAYEGGPAGASMCLALDHFVAYR